MIYIVFFILLFLCSNPNIQQLFASFLGKDKPNAITGLCLAFLCCVLVILSLSLNDKNKEPFLFKVSDFNPRCNGMYNGKPTTFQYDRMGCNYNEPVGSNPDIITSNQKSIKSFCNQQQNPPLGMNANKDSQLYGNEYKI